MAEVRDSPEFQVGEVVRVVDEPYKDCPFSWVNNMDEWCGRRVEILDRHWSSWYDCYAYEIEREYCWSFCGNCFVRDSTDSGSEDEDSELDVSGFSDTLFAVLNIEGR